MRVVEPGGDDERHHGDSATRAAVGAGEKRLFAIEREAARRSLDGIVCEVDAAIVEEGAESGKALEHAVDRRADPG